MLESYNATQRLTISGTAAAVVYIGGAVFYTNGADSHTRTAREVFAWITVVTLLPLFWWGWKAVERSEEDASVLRVLIAFAAAFALVALLTTPYHSTDVFGYVNRGWQQFHYGQDPYVHTVSEISARAADPMLREHWIYNPDPYGFIFTEICYVACLLGQGNWWLTLLVLKLVNVFAFAGTGVLLWSGAKLIGLEKPIRPLYLFLWNPLVVVHDLANGHNDLLVGVFVLAAFWLALRRYYFWIAPAVMVGILIKYAPIVMLPFAAVLVWRKSGLVRAAASCLLSGGIAAISSLPYIGDWRSFKLEDIRDNAELIDNSLHSFLVHIYELVMKTSLPLQVIHDGVSSAIANTLRGLVLVCLVWLFFRFWRRSDEQRFLKYSSLSLFLLIFVASSKLNAWYIGMLLGPVLLLEPKYWLRRLMVLISMTETAGITFLKQAYIVNYFLMMLLPQLYVWWRMPEPRRAEKRGSRLSAILAETPNEIPAKT
jgi:hypothetical protein